jgi:hypothetical protein
MKLPRTYMKALRLSKENDGRIDRDAAIVAAYWYCTHYHSGQFSREYAELCWLGNYYRPNMECGPQEGSWEEVIYQELCAQVEAMPS